MKLKCIKCEGHFKGLSNAKCPTCNTDMYVVATESRNHKRKPIELRFPAKQGKCTVCKKIKCLRSSTQPICHSCAHWKDLRPVHHYKKRGK